MTRILIAIAATIGTAGVALAQQAPVLSGDYSANVSANYGAEAGNAAMLDMDATASVRTPMAADRDMAADGAIPADRAYDIYTGQ